MISNEELDKIKMNFIIGPGRSGTTLLMMLLNQSEECIATPEVKHLMYFYNRFGKMTKISSKMRVEYQDYFKLYIKSSSNPLYNIKIEKVLSIFEDEKIINYSQLNKKIHIGLHDKPYTKVKSIIDKNNLYTFYFQKINKIYPEAKYCVLIRDYRAFVSSNIESQHKFKENKSTMFYAFVWLQYAKKIQKLSLTFPDKIKIVKYENLVDQPKVVLNEIYSFFGLNYNDNIFDYRLSIEEKVKKYSQSSNPDPRMLKKIEDLSKPISNKRIKSWQEKLDDKTIRKIELICGEIGTEYGYVKNFKRSKLHSFLLKSSYIFTQLRVFLFFKINSIYLHHYLNVKRRVKHNKVNQYSK